MIDTFGRPATLLLFFSLSTPANVLARDLTTHEDLNAVLWTQSAAEYAALTMQAFNLAKTRLDEALRTPDWTAALEQRNEFSSLPPAIIVDIGQTLLDNCPFEASCVLADTSFDATAWDRWVESGSAPALPGAVDFCRYADERGVAIYYVTNRRGHLKEATRRNLVERGFPIEEGDHSVLTRDTNSDKGPRRARICEKYRILLLLGDNLGDFVSGSRSDPEARKDLASEYASHWGRKWIILPNPMFGGWEGSLIDFDWSLSDSDKVERKYDRLRDSH